jgi:hypothetical protein
MPRLTNPDGSYFDAPDDDTIVKQKPKGDVTDDTKMRGWYRDPNGWWKNPDPDRAWDPKPAGK